MSRNDSRGRPWSKRPRTLLPALVVTLLLTLGGATAWATSNIEGVWAFNGGEIAVQPAANGQFQGTVVTATKFAECTHPVGQVIWTGMTLQPDGSYWGFHQWYFENSSCALNPLLGPTAWRVVEGNGARYLRVCLSNPGSGQPSIPPSGTATGSSYGCVNSAPASVEVASFKLVSLPGTKKCLSLRHFQIHIRDPRNDAFKTVNITLRGHKLAALRRGKYFVATVNLKGLPPGAFTIHISATTVVGHHISGHRTYHTCASKKVAKSKKSPKKKH